MRMRSERWALWCVLATAVAFLVIGTDTALGQGFMVRPMRMEVVARPGETIEMGLELRNTRADGARSLDIALHEIAQTSEGAWIVARPDSGMDLSRLSSCKAWTPLDAYSVEIPPLERKTVTVSMSVPHGARGHYFAGITAQNRPPPATQGVRMVTRFLIPVIVQIQGRPVRQRIEITDVGMDVREGDAGRPASTLVSLGIGNEGRTYSRVRGSVRVMYDMDGRWRPVANAEVRERAIIPGSRLRLRSDLERRLPSGRYRLTGTLYVDGRRARGLEKEIDFEGDPEVTRLAVDSALTLEPLQVSLEAAPGATRTAVLQIENPGEDALHVSAFAETPPSLRGVMLGETRGDEFSCAEWLSVLPSDFVLRPGGRQNVRLVARMPRDNTRHANYYGLVGLRAEYPDGQSAGASRTLVAVGNRSVEDAPDAQVERMALAEVEGARYAVQARFANVGNVHFDPRCQAAVLTPRGSAVATIPLSGGDGPMLPLETRDFSGEIDFGGIEPGAYALQAGLSAGGGHGATKQILILVSDEEGQREVTVITEEEAEAEGAEFADDLPTLPVQDAGADGAE